MSMHATLRLPMTGCEHPGSGLRHFLASHLLMLAAIVLGFAVASLLTTPSLARADAPAERMTHLSEAGVSAPVDSELVGLLPPGLEGTLISYVTIDRLAAVDLSLDEKLVSFRGEAVGEPRRSSAEGYQWVVLQSVVSSSPIDVLMPDEIVDLITNYRSYQKSGTVLLITGVYRVADRAQEGTLDVTAYQARIIREGGLALDTRGSNTAWLGVGAVVIGCALLGVGAFFKHRSLS